MHQNQLRKAFLLLVSLIFILGVAAGPATAADGGRPFTTTMTGAQEVPNPGDPDGSGTASITLNQGEGIVCWELTVTGIAPATAAHIHRGAAGVPGGVVVPLSPPTNGSSSGCASANPDLIKEIRKFPDRFYVNVHNAEYPAGALRGQLGK